MNADFDHEKTALGQMLSEAAGREVQLRIVLGKMQAEVARLREENERLSAQPANTATRTPKPFYAEPEVVE